MDKLTSEEKSLQPEPGLYDRTMRYTPWLKMLGRDKNGVLDKSLYNLHGILALDPELQGIRYNQMADCIEVTKPLPWRSKTGPWGDTDDAQLINYMDTHFVPFPLQYYQPALLKAADDNKYHPVRSFFLSLPDWDETPRVETLLVDYLGAADTAYTRAVTRKTIMAAVRRAFQPGVKFDQILVLAGPQGIGKSTLISRMGMDWYTDSLSMSDMNDKTAAEKIQGYWLVEIGEMAGMRKADLEKVKAFISRQDDKYRPAYSRRVMSHPRQCVFFGTTNNADGYLRDVTGNRRFWTVPVTGEGRYKPWDLDADTVRQIWAEAVLIDASEPLYLDYALNKDAEEMQRQALEQDDREGIVRDYLELPLPADWPQYNLERRQSFVADPKHLDRLKPGRLRDRVCNMEIWCECFGRRKEDLTRRDSAQISAIMARIVGWKREERATRIPLYGMQRNYQKQDDL